jgi:CheY-like chemotaxis protein
MTSLGISTTARDDEDRPRLRTLVADDHDFNRQVMQVLLTHLGCAVEVAASGEEAVAAARARSFDLVVMDLNMPDIDGDEATGRLREAGASRLAYVVRWSAEDSGRLDAGLYDGELPKPILAVSLAQAVSAARRRAMNRADEDGLDDRPNLALARLR